MSERAARRGAAGGTGRMGQGTLPHDRLVAAITVVAALGFLVPGMWAFLAPSSFYEWVALFPPYNRHFLHDVGAFQLGLGATLLLALRWRDARLVALVGSGMGGALHAVSHVLDRQLGGRQIDTPSLGLLAILLGLAALLRWHATREER